MAASLASEVRFPPGSGPGTVRGTLHAPEGEPSAAVVLTHGRSSDMCNPFLRRMASGFAESGVAALRINFRYVEEGGRASRDLSREEDDLRGALRFLRKEIGPSPIFVAGKSMGARVCARASSDPEIRGVIALGYPLHPKFRPEVQNPPEWPLIAKPFLLVQGDQDPFGDLARLQEELARLPEAHTFVVIRNAGHSFEPRGAKRDTFPEVFAAVIEWIRDTLARENQ